MAYKRVITVADANDNYRPIATRTVYATTTKELGEVSAFVADQIICVRRYIFTDTREILPAELPADYEPFGVQRQLEQQQLSQAPRIEPLSLQFNAIVQTMARKVCPCGYDVSDDAPASYEALREHVERTGRICVWKGASEETIFGDREINWAFRAWHDWTHYTYKCDFSDLGEGEVFCWQLADVAKVYGAKTAEKIRPILQAEVIGQLEYKNVHGEFPTNQRAFVKQYLVRAPYSAALAKVW